jgi:hypothetical protein
MILATVIIVNIVIWGTVGGLIGAHKGRLGEGIAWGVLLGVIGVIVIACRKPGHDRPAAGLDGTGPLARRQLAGGSISGDVARQVREANRQARGF